MRSFPLTIATASETRFEGEAVSLTVPGSEGELTILKDHESLVSLLRPGTITARTEASEDPQTFDIEKGILEVHKGGVVVLL